MRAPAKSRWLRAFAFCPMLPKLRAHEEVCFHDVLTVRRSARPPGIETMRALSEISFLPDQCGAGSLRAVWSWRIPESYRAVLLSLFGDWFLADAQDRIHMLDLVSGKLHLIAVSEAEFFAKLDLEDHRCEWLKSHLVEAVEQEGIQRAPSQCLAFRTPPMLGGALAPSNIVPWDFAAYQTGTSKVLRQVADLPLGSQVIIKPT